MFLSFLKQRTCDARAGLTSVKMAGERISRACDPLRCGSFAQYIEAAGCGLHTSQNLLWERKHLPAEMQLECNLKQL